MNPGVKLTADGSPLTAGLLKVGSGAPVLPDGIAAALRTIEREAFKKNIHLARNGIVQFPEFIIIIIIVLF